MQDEYQVLNTAATTYVDTDVDGETAARAYGVRVDWTAAQAATAAVNSIHAAAACSATETQSVTTGITQPSCARNVTATTSGTSGDVKAVSVTIYGARAGVDISEVLTAFTVNTNETVTGNKAFDAIYSYSVPAMDGTGCSVAIGVGDKLGLPIKMSRNTLQSTYLADALEGTAATVAVSITALESNTIDLNSALNGTAVKAYFLLP
jgi:hypothetical protein